MNETEFNITWGKSLKAHRKLLKMSRSKLGRLLGGVHRNTIERWEKGEHSVSLFYYDQIRGILGETL